MRFHKAEISDILRCSQRDEEFINELQDYFVDILKVLTGSQYNTVRQHISLCANAWYYLLTSVSNIQTLGEEYTGTIRTSHKNELPSKFGQILWLGLYIGGDKLYDKLLSKLGKSIYFSQTLTDEAKSVLLTSTNFMKENKHIFLRLHQSFFYIYGTYHNVSNRIAGIKYILLREWMQDTSAVTSFNILGKISLVYLIFLLYQKVVSSKKSFTSPSGKGEITSSKTCVLCVENCNNISSTPCGHLFCWDCIYDSLQHQPNCPVCREDVKPSRIILLQNY